MKKVLLLLANGFEAVEASVFTDVLGWNQSSGDGSTKLVTVGLRDRLQCTFNFTVIPEMTLDEVDVDEFDALAIPGGFEDAGFYQDAYHEEFLDVIRKFDQAEKIIATVCVASLPVAKSGVLKGRKATSYNLKGGIRQQELATYGVHVVNEPIVIDKNIITSYNPSTAFDVAFHLLEQLTTEGNCNHVKKLMGFVKD
ncbi:DJ-1/PfpI family protein [Paenibacillus dendritiformis]|uniref:DJ-1/PfpI family protein n=1 Tax=Paenibacillus dendritiformis TaxID=130049 RepID=UPI00248BC638|nr:DJ-1/PfpI family protein [Paenibacillus dendritiformis]WGU93946.1 DJ-1/PfpI family protein [Paenibacillus dendritiformis]